VRTVHEVTAILPEQGVLVRSLEKGKESGVAFDKLVIATGAIPINASFNLA